MHSVLVLARKKNFLTHVIWSSLEQFLFKKFPELARKGGPRGYTKKRRKPQKWFPGSQRSYLDSRKGILEKSFFSAELDESGGGGDLNPPLLGYMRHGDFKSACSACIFLAESGSQI